MPVADLRHASGGVRTRRNTLGKKAGVPAGNGDNNGTEQTIDNFN